MNDLTPTQYREIISSLKIEINCNEISYKEKIGRLTAALEVEREAVSRLLLALAELRKVTQ